MLHSIKRNMKMVDIGICPVDVRSIVRVLYRTEYGEGVEFVRAGNVDWSQVDRYELMPQSEWGGCFRPETGDFIRINFYDRSGDNWETVQVAYAGRVIVYKMADGTEGWAEITEESINHWEKVPMYKKPEPCPCCGRSS